MKIFCLAYAGGDGHVFLPFSQKLEEQGLELIPFYYRGRGSRQDEGSYQTIQAAAEDAANFIASFDLSQGYHVLGFSLGALVTYDLYYALVKRGLPAPNYLIFCGALPPSHLLKDRLASKENPGPLLARLEAMGGGITPELINSPDFQRYFLPLLINDFKLYEDYIYKPAEQLITSQVRVCYGSQDQYANQDIKRWQDLVASEVEFIEMPGNHFFLFAHQANYAKVFSGLRGNND